MGKNSNKHYDRMTDKGEKYIQSYPELGKWINQCMKCGARGYKPEMPDVVGIPTVGKYIARNIRRRFKELSLKNGVCEICECNTMVV